MTKITHKATAVVSIDHQVLPESSRQVPNTIPSHLMALTFTCFGLRSGMRTALSFSARTGTSHLQTNRPTVPEIRMNTTSHSLLSQRTLGLAVFANSRPLLRSAIHSVLESLLKAQATIRAAGACLERGFADFADIPYQDARTQQQLSQLLDVCSFSCQMEYSTQQRNVSMCAANDRGSCRRCGERIW